MPDTDVELGSRPSRDSHPATGDQERNNKTRRAHSTGQHNSRIPTEPQELMDDPEGRPIGSLGERGLPESI